MHAKKLFLFLGVPAVAALIVGGAVSNYILVNASTLPVAPAAEVLPVTSAPPSDTSDQRPAWLLVPSLALRASVQHVGRTASGLMSNPSNFTDVGWYRYGPAPGEVGSAVLAGHLDNALGLAAVFKHLSDIELGDVVVVQTESGDLLNFHVTGIDEYEYTQVPSEVFTQEGGRYLNLITCSGEWLPAQKTYSHRVVVRTRLEG